MNAFVITGRACIEREGYRQVDHSERSVCRQYRRDSNFDRNTGQPDTEGKRRRVSRARMSNSICKRCCAIISMRQWFYSVLYEKVGVFVNHCMFYF